jgi:tetratricopeptide (TPR) repeat protein
MQAQKALDQLIEFSRQHYISPYNFAVYYSGLGDRDKAIEYLNKAYAKHDTNLVGLDVNRGLDNLRGDPRFEEIERRVGF